MIYALRAGDSTTREAIISDVALRSGRHPDKVRAAVSEQIDAAIEDGTLVEGTGGALTTRDYATNWVLHDLPDESQGCDDTSPDKPGPSK